MVALTLTVSDSQGQVPTLLPQAGLWAKVLLCCRVPEDDGGCAVRDQTFLGPAAAPSPAANGEQQLHSARTTATCTGWDLHCAGVPALPHWRLSFSSSLLCAVSV